MIKMLYQFTATQACWRVYNYINVIEDNVHDYDTFIMLLERYNSLIHDECLKEAFPVKVWGEVEAKLLLVQLSAYCGMDDIVSFLEMLANIKTVIRAYFASMKMMSNRLRTACSDSVGDLYNLHIDCIKIIDMLL